jgi:FtsH-binding integral membrane protein
MFSSQARPVARQHGALLGRVFGLLGFSFVLTAIGAVVAPRLGPEAANFGAVGGLFVLIILIVGRRLSSTVRLGLFYVFSVLQGLVLGLVINRYIQAGQGDIVVLAAATTAGLVFVLSTYAWTTKRNVQSIGGYLFVGLIGVLVAVIFGLFIQAPLYHVVLSAAIGILFSLYMVYHVQQLKLAGPGGDAVGLAIALYIDLLNIFWAILRLLTHFRR